MGDQRLVVREWTAVSYEGMDRMVTVGGDQQVLVEAETDKYMVGFRLRISGGCPPQCALGK